MKNDFFRSDISNPTKPLEPRTTEDILEKKVDPLRHIGKMELPIINIPKPNTHWSGRRITSGPKIGVLIGEPYR